jgi:glycerate-2-kinase
MTHVIENFKKLAHCKQRQDALEIVEAAYTAIDTKTVLNNSIMVIDNIMTVMGQRFDLHEYKNIYIIGFGKVSCRAAYVLEELLAGKVREGAVVGIKEVTCQVVNTYAGTHPLPSHINLTATKHIEEIAKKATVDDLVLVVVSGGGSALLCSSLEELEQGQRLYEKFLHAGGTIEEINLVRKHISHLKGGGLAKALYPATVVSLIFSDVPGGDLASIASGPTHRDTTSIEEAQAIIDRYNLGSFRLNETQYEEKYFYRVYNILVASNLTALRAMEEKASQLGYASTVISATQYATAEETVAVFQHNIQSQSAYVMGGETKMLIPEGVCGIGGRNTHLALSMLDTLSDSQVFISFASDGHDNTDAAGAIVDSNTARVATELSLNPIQYRDNFDSYAFFEQTGDLIFTQSLESNVSDLMLLLTAQVDEV